MGGDSGMDIRLPMGLMFSLIGAIIAGYGFSMREADFSLTPSEGYNINLIWGAVMLVFGLLMLLLTAHAANRRGVPVVMTGTPLATPDDSVPPM